MADRDDALYEKETQAYRKAIQCYVTELDKLIPFAGTEHSHSTLAVVKLPAGVPDATTLDGELLPAGPSPKLAGGQGMIVTVVIRFSAVTDLEQLKELIAAATDAPGSVAVG